MNLALGTVQFGLNYGIANAAGQTPRDEAARIVARARELGFDTLDTAAAYGESERVLGETGVSGWKVVTKVPRFKRTGEDGRQWVRRHVEQSLAALGVEGVHAVLMHHAPDLLGEAGRGIAEGLHELKAAGLAGKVGYSVYSPAALAAATDVLTPDIIQAPLSIVDQRLVKSGWLARFADAGVEVHVRSVFLQGLLLMPPHRRPASFDRWSDLWQRWDRTVERHGGSALAVCLGFIRHQREISCAVVGVDNLSHLEQLHAAWLRAEPADGEGLSCDATALVEPVNWTAA